MNSTYQFFKNYHSKAQNSSSSGPFAISLWRDQHLVNQYQFTVEPDGTDTPQYLKVLIKSLLWIYGADRLTMNGDEKCQQIIKSFFAANGSLAFEKDFFSNLFDREFLVESQSTVSNSLNEKKSYLGLSSVGLRVGLDLGGSSIKACLLDNGKIIATQLREWSPLDTKEPKDASYIVEQIILVIESLLAGGRKPDSIGISTAGVVIEGELYLSALYRYFTHPKECRNLVDSLSAVYSCPINLINDGEAAALELDTCNGALAIVMGSDEGGGYLAPMKRSLDQINELAFVPVCLDEDAPIDSWSQHRGCGGVYLSVRGQNHFVGQGLSLDQSAAEIGRVLAHALAFYRFFFQYQSVILLGGVTSDGRRAMMEESCKKEWEKLNLDNINISFITPQDQFRFQQAVTAAKLQREKNETY